MNQHLPDLSSVESLMDHFDGDDPSWAVAATDQHFVAPQPVRASREPGPTEPRDAESIETHTTEFFPKRPESFRQSGLRPSQVEALVLKFLLNRGDATGREIADQVALPFGMLEGLLANMKADQLVAHRAAAAVGDFLFELTPRGGERARRYAAQSTYFGAAPVSLHDYVVSVLSQSVTRQKPTVEAIRRAYADMVLADETVMQIGEAINLGLGFFVYGLAGNGKTSIAERAIRAYRPSIWIPRAINAGGEIVRLFDPTMHEPWPAEEHPEFPYDHRWVLIRRPVLIAGGDLKLDDLEVTTNRITGISEAPLQAKCNCGILVLDDFGRYPFEVSELLNRLIVPLDKRFDCLHLPSGRTFPIPFDPLVVFSTNLDPADLVDEAFLRRIPHKLEVNSPTEQQFRLVLAQQAHAFGLELPDEAADHLLDGFYRNGRYAMRFCHPRDLMRHIQNACRFRRLPPVATLERLDAAVLTCLGSEQLAAK